MLCYGGVLPRALVNFSRVARGVFDRWLWSSVRSVADLDMGLDPWKCRASTFMHFKGNPTSASLGYFSRTEFLPVSMRAM